MKKISLTGISILLIAVCAQAQGVRLNGYAAYVFDDKFDSYYSSTDYVNGKIKGGFQWGVGLEVTPREDLGVELLYIRQDTEAPVTFYSGIDRNKTIDLGISYIMLGGTHYRMLGEKIEPYGGLMLGMAIFSNKNPDQGAEDSATKFAWGIRLGTNVWVSEKVGIKLQAQLLSAVQGAGGSLYFGTGGAGAGVSTYSSLLQFALGGGLVFKVK